jgi:endonuclease YncB( thermonuclease family)
LVMKNKPLTFATALCLSSLTGCPLSNLAQQSEGRRFADQQTEYWTVERVHDGDTLWIAQDGNEEKVRLCGIDAPELEQPLGPDSRNHLQQLVDQSPSGEVGVISVERDQYDRLVAEVFIPGSGDEEIHVNSQMVADGMAYVYERYVDGCPNGMVIAGAEGRAQEASLGVWSGGQMPPWEYRRQNR